MAANQTRIQCSECILNFPDKSTWSSHLSLHSLPGKIGCGACGKKSAHDANWLIHFRNITEVLLLCEECPKDTETEEEKLYHINFHPTDRPYNCQVCTFKFHTPTPQNMNEDYVPHYLCLSCGKIFYSEDDFQVQARHDEKCEFEPSKCKMIFILKI